MRAPAPDRAPTAEGATVAIAGRHADQGRDLLPRARPQLGACPPQRAGPHGPHARGTLPQIVIFPPPRAGPEPRLAVVVQRGDTRMAPRHRGRKSLREARARPRQAVRLRGPHDPQWLAAPTQGTQRLRLGVRQRARRRAHPVGTMRQRARIPRLRFGQRPGGACAIPGLARVAHHDGQARHGQGAGHQALPAACGFQAPSGRGGGPGVGPHASSPR